MEDYFAAKMRLFDEVVADGGTAVIWMDDEWAVRACEHARARGLGVLTVGEQAQGGSACSPHIPGQLGQELELEHGGRSFTR